ncbi:hypothetical protein F4781DRAFT_34946 [Annulohypoxylon bovei var. microspora]|nr:hypothetical protein F4781DRAFT_34946 [Annulohypoxylon bovei var. microspora]
MSYQLRPSQPSPSQQEAGYDAYSNTNTYTYSQEYGYGHGHGHGQYVYAQAQPPQQYQPDMRHAHAQPPSPLPAPLATPATYPQDGLARAHTWIANQPAVLSPPAAAKTPFSEWAAPTDSTFDRRTLYSPSMPPRPPGEDTRVCGVKRNSFFVVLAVGLFLLVVAVAVGLGVGLGTRNSAGVAADSAAANVGAGSSSSSSSLPSTSTTPTSTTPTSTKVSPTPSFTGTAVLGPVICPQNNNTVYVAQGSSKPFNIQCGRDYNSANGARDISHMQESTMASCINACGNRDDCVGVGWGYYQGTYECWMKSKLGEPNSSSSWYFAQLQDMPDQ